MTWRLNPLVFWKNLSVARKLYSVVGVMAVLIAAELLTLLFAMNTLSAMRASVGGEAFWSKAKTGAIIELQNYARTQDEKYYQAFLQRLEVPLGFRQARIEMQKPDMDIEIVREGFLRGGVHPDDVVPMVNLMRRFHQTSYIQQAILVWERADSIIEELIEVSIQLKEDIQLDHTGVDNRLSEHQVQSQLENISVIGEKFATFETEFSSALGAASRKLEDILMILLILAVATVEITGLILAASISRGLTRGLKELNDFTKDVGSGDISKRVPVRSADELGQLAMALNKMVDGLEEMNSERKVAEKANRIKSLFLANMSHEIRTPLSAILGFVDLLKNNTLTTQERSKYLEIIERTGLGLNTIINDILDISKVEAGKMELENTAFEPKQLIHDLESLLQLRCDEKGIQLTFESEPLPEAIVADPSRLKQILLNIIGNAIKFTAKGGVRASFRVARGKFICIVDDTGVGISPENFDLLFRPFSQVDLSIRKQFGGTGLGLILSRRLAQLMGGDVRLQRSEPGKGSTFEIIVGYELATNSIQPQRLQDSPPPNFGASLSTKKILVVEDSLDNQLLAREFLTKAGAEVAIAGNGLEALETITHQSFDLILMDMQMPIMDGYSATLELRRLGYHIPIIALTANAMKDDLEKCLIAGCDDYLCKPFKRGELIELIGQHCREALNSCA